jgi:hypothetical protein
VKHGVGICGQWSREDNLKRLHCLVRRADYAAQAGQELNYVRHRANALDIIEHLGMGPTEVYLELGLLGALTLEYTGWGEHGT